MFGKKKRKPQISGPINFEHRVHTGFDQQEGKYVWLYIGYKFLKVLYIY